jgi:hypothetical protein
MVVLNVLACLGLEDSQIRIPGQVSWNLFFTVCPAGHREEGFPWPLATYFRWKVFPDLIRLSVFKYDNCPVRAIIRADKGLIARIPTKAEIHKSASLACCFGVFFL